MQRRTFLIRILCLFPVLALIPIAYGTIHGIDDRKNYFEVTDPLARSFADSIAVQIHSHLIVNDGDRETRKVMGIPFTRQIPLCGNEKFANEFTLGAGGCTAFLISADVLVTAGHCFEDAATPTETAETICRGRSWIFGAYAKSAADLRFDPIPNDGVFGLSRHRWNVENEIYQCKEVLFAPPPIHNIDVAIFRLDRPTKGRKFFQLREKGRPDTTVPLVTIGSSQQGFLKFSDHAHVIETPAAEKEKQGDTMLFRSNLDTFVGNSGGPVFDARTGLVEGILVGASGKNYAFQDSCNRYGSAYPETEGHTYAQRATVIAPVVHALFAK